MTPEGKVKASIRALLAQYEPRMEYWPVPSGYGKPSLDCLLLYKGEFIGIEAKRPGAKPTRLQSVTISQIVAAGGRCFVIDGPEALGRLKDVLDELRRR
jgi:hypothetical protein